MANSPTVTTTALSFIRSPAGNKMATAISICT
jgi:hypothetical protein